MKDIKSFILEGSRANALYNCCLQLDNNEQIYKSQYFALIQNTLVQHQKGELSIASLEKSPKLDQLCASCIKAAKVHLSEEDNKKLHKLVTASLLTELKNEGEDLSNDEQKYVDLWDHRNLNW